MKIVNINDIEDLILAKHEIDLMLIEDGIIDKRTEINYFLETYAMPNKVYIYNDKTIPFTLYEIHNNKYLFVTNYNQNELDILQAKIKQIKYNLNNLIEIKFNDLIDKNNPEDNNFIVINNKYYR
jgi:hypothetical protein